MTFDPTNTELKSFGRRRGRKPTDRQAALLATSLPKLSLDLSQPITPRGQTWLEIGFGGGEHLLWQARHNPDIDFIGCEPFEDGVIKVLAALDAEPASNIRLHMGDARDVLRALPDASIARCFILFPDPWPKRKHAKRRLVNAALLDSLARVLVPGAQLRIGTDIGGYARTVLEAYAGEPRFVWQAQGPNDWRVRPDDWPPTRYEAKAEAAGRQRYYFRFQRVEGKRQ